MQKLEALKRGEVGSTSAFLSDLLANQSLSSQDVTGIAVDLLMAAVETVSGLECRVYIRAKNLGVGGGGGCLFKSQQHAGVSQGRIGPENCTCCHTKMEAADPTQLLSLSLSLAQSQYTDTGPSNSSVDPIMPGSWQGSVSTRVLLFTSLVWLQLGKGPQESGDQT